MRNTREKASTEKNFMLAAVCFAFLMLIIIFISGATADDNSYNLLTPSVYQGEELSGADFIEVKGFLSGCRAAPYGTIPTDEAGTHTVRIRIDGNGGYTRDVDCSYEVKPLFRNDPVIEACGRNVTVDDILAPGVPDDVVKKLSPSVEGDVPAYSLGAASVTVSVGKLTLDLEVEIEDTTPPKAQPKTVIVTSAVELPAPAEFVDSVEDATNVTCTFAEEYDFTEPGVISVDIIMTDEGGNTSKVTSTADCRIDNIPPTLSWDGDLVVQKNGTVSYRSGVTASDNSGGNVTFTVNADSVDLSKLGEYTVIYTAVDEAGNTATFERKLTVVEKLPPSETLVRTIAEDIYNTYIHTDPAMTKWDIAYAIFRWTHDTLTYVGTGIDKSNWLAAAYDGFATHSGDCFTYMSISRAMLEAAGIDCLVVEHMAKNESDNFHHWWLLVNIGDGWYHFDSTRRKLCPQFEAFMRTDEELMWYRENYDDGYYRFDSDSGVYPERATTSYYGTVDDILTSPGDLDH